MNCFSTKIHYVSLIHVGMVENASMKAMTLTASAQQGLEDVSAMLVNTTSENITFLLTTQYMHTFTHILTG